MRRTWLASGDVSKLGFEQSAVDGFGENTFDAPELPVVCHGVDLIDQCLRQAALYPRWLVITSTVLAGIAVFWIVAKLLKWTLILLLTFLVVAIVAGALLWWLG
jgi:hypothetical protein